MEMKTKTLFAAMSFLTICSMAAQAQIPQQSIRWDKHSLIFDGKRVVLVMGEVHYSRIPQNEWREEVRKMKEGGVTMIAAYVFWNHVEEVEGVFNWSGQRNLRGYYMYHGGTNPTAMMPGNLDDGSAVYLNENQRTQATNYNDMPVKTYDFQAPLGEFGQKNPHYFMLRKLHLFMHDYAEVLICYGTVDCQAGWKNLSGTDQGYSYRDSCGWKGAEECEGEGNRQAGL